MMPLGDGWKTSISIFEAELVEYESDIDLGLLESISPVHIDEHTRTLNPFPQFDAA